MTSSSPRSASGPGLPSSRHTRYPPKLNWALTALVGALIVVFTSQLQVHGQQVPLPAPTPPPLPPASAVLLTVPANNVTANNATTNATTPTMNSTVPSGNVNTTLPALLLTLPMSTSTLALNCTSSQDCPGHFSFCTSRGTCALSRCGLPQLNATLLPCMLFNSSTFCTHLASGLGLCTPKLPAGAACNFELDATPLGTSNWPIFRLNATHVPQVNVTSPAPPGSLGDTSTPIVFQLALRNEQCLGSNYCSPTLRRCVPNPSELWVHDPNNREGKMSVWMALVVMVGGLVALALWVALCTSGMIRCSRMYQRNPKLRWCVDRLCGGVCCCCFAACRKRARRQPVLPFRLGKIRDEEMRAKESESVTSSAASSQIANEGFQPIPHPLTSVSASSIPAQHVQVPFSPPLPPRPTHQQLVAMLQDSNSPPGPSHLSPLPHVVASSPLVLPQFDLAKQLATGKPSPSAPSMRLSMMEPAIADGVLPPMAPHVYPPPLPPPAVHQQPYQQQPYASPMQQPYSPSTGSSSSSMPLGSIPGQQQQQQQSPRPWNVGKP